MPTKLLIPGAAAVLIALASGANAQTPPYGVIRSTCSVGLEVNQIRSILLGSMQDASRLYAAQGVEVAIIENDIVQRSRGVYIEAANCTDNVSPPPQKSCEDFPDQASFAAETMNEDQWMLNQLLPVFASSSGLATGYSALGLASYAQYQVGELGVCVPKMPV